MQELTTHLSGIGRFWLRKLAGVILKDLLFYIPTLIS